VGVAISFPTHLPPRNQHRTERLPACPVIEQNADSDVEAAAVLRFSVSFPFDELKIRVAKLAAKYDGKPPGED
jgi:hypothetical protein